jgi:phytoene desaturase
MSKAAIIGGGFSGLSAACFMAKHGHEVTVFEKNASAGGRARSFSEQGFMFDMGPSWYWMPDVFERFFGEFGRSTDDYYQLVQLDPGFQVIFGKDDVLPVPAGIDGIYDVFEQIETGSADKLKKFLAEGKFKYEVGMRKLVYKPSFSWREFATAEVLVSAARLQLFRSVRAHVRGYFKDERLIALMEFPSLFLGATAQNIPALYSLMNYAALSLGTWYPKGGMVEIVKAMEHLASSLNVDIITGCEVSKIEVHKGVAAKINTSKGDFSADGIIASGDYHHMEQSLLDAQHRNYQEAYWEGKTFAPSCLIFYVGISKKVKKLIHHNLFFDASLDVHSSEIYDSPQWPVNPLFYVCCPSKTDDSVAPAGMENLFILMPIAAGLEDTEENRERYFHMIMNRIEQFCEDTVLPHVVYKRSYCINDFVGDYHAYKGNAYGLANTLRQTAVLKPSMKNKKVKNIFYAGQLTVPGPGVPPAIISGQIAAAQLSNYLKRSLL